MKWIRNRPPSFWVVLYLLLIPVASYAYYLLPAGSFTDANLSREPDYKRDLSTVAGLVACSAKDQEYRDVQTPNGRKYPIPMYKFGRQQLYIEPATINVPPASISVDSSGNITLSVEGYVQYGRGGGNPAPVCSNTSAGFGNFSDVVTVTVPHSTQATVSNPSGHGNTMLEGYTVSFSPTTSNLGEPPLNVLLPSSNSGMGGPAQLNPTSSFLWVPLNESRIIDRLSAEGEGDPKEAAGFYLRMTYFSATTITTLGFGDITPVTSAARASVGVEAIFGVVLIGLFLNSVANKWGKSSNQASPTP